jgi:hypothetical protein
MTERIDLRALDAAARPGEADRVVGAVRARIAGAGDHGLGELDRLLRPALLAAALLVALALGVLSATARGTAAPDPELVLVAWAEAQHVPSNAELLAAFQGYAR